MEKFSIQESMHKEHLELEKMANKALGGFEMDNKEQLALFEKYRKKLEAHIGMEEKAIYAISQKLDAGLQKLIRQIFADHEKMRFMLVELYKKLQSDKHQSATEVFSLTKGHHLLEEKSFYIKLDVGLSAEERRVFEKEFKKKR